MSLITYNSESLLIKKLINYLDTYNIIYGINKQIFINPNDFIYDKVITNDHIPFIEKNKYVVNLIPYKFPSSHHTLNDNFNNVNWEYVDTFYKVLYDFLNRN